jgi:flagellar biosynthetic protein FliR
MPWLDPAWQAGMGIVLVRMVGMFAALPSMTGRAFSLRLYGVFILWLSWLIQLSSPVYPQTQTWVSMAWEIVGSFLVGMSVGLAVRLTLDGLHFAGELIGVNIGLGMAGVVDPATGGQQNPISRLFTLGAMVMMLAADLHLAMFELLRVSLTWTPDVALWMWAPNFAAEAIIVDGVRLALPVVGSVTLIYLLFGVLARVAPQVQIFQIAYGVTILAGITVLLGEIPAIPDLVDGFLQRNLTALSDVVR